MKLYENNYVVLSAKDINEYLDEVEKGKLTQIVDTIEREKNIDTEHEINSIHIPYVSREFCKHIQYDIQKVLEESEDPDTIATMVEQCRTRCRAYDLHDYLQEKGFKILKEAE